MFSKIAFRQRGGDPLNLTRLEKAVVQRKFIRYCIKVLDGEALNYLDEMDKIWEREINFSELREEILDGFLFL